MLSSGHDEDVARDVLGTRTLLPAHENRPDHASEKVPIRLDLAPAGERLLRRFCHCHRLYVVSASAKALARPRKLPV